MYGTETYCKQCYCMFTLIARHGEIMQTYFSISAISLTASIPPGNGSSSMKKFLDCQMLMALSCSPKKKQ